MGRTYLFLMDPIERIDIEADSTFALMLEAQRRGDDVWYAHPSALEWDGAVYVPATKVFLERRAGAHVQFGETRRCAADEMSAIFMRRDPPYDVAYLVATYLLDRVDEERVVMVNRPSALRSINEKLSILPFADLCPRTIVTPHADRIHAFLGEVGAAVAKPLMQAGGEGVAFLQAGDRNLSVLIEILTQRGSTPIEVQAFVPNVTAGDKRIILLNGDPIGALNRRPKKGELRANMHVGGTPEPAVLTEREVEICRSIGPWLAEAGVVFAGIDVIDGFLTEVNVTSPTGLQEIDRFDGVCLEGQILDWVAQTADARRV